MLCATYTSTIHLVALEHKRPCAESDTAIPTKKWQPKLAATRVLGESTAKHTVTSSAILLHNPTFNALTAIS